MTRKREGIKKLDLWVHDTLAKIYRSGEPTDATGARVRLWCISCDEDEPGTLPADDAKLAEWSGLTLERWMEVRKFVVESWEKDESRSFFSIPRIKFQLKRVEKWRKGGKRGAAMRWKDRELDSPPNGHPIERPLTYDTDRPLTAHSHSHSHSKNKDNCVSDETLFDPQGGSNAAEASDPVDRKNGKPTDAEVQAVYRHYLDARGLTEQQYRLTPQRKTKIRTRLKEFSVDAICLGIDACMRSDFHAGKNDRNEVYQDLVDHILRSHEKLEKWVNKGEGIDGKPTA